uniref:Uncharacterized protein n=1 Tax=Populus trichocarpa TaxID=3694 RepID=A0A3N7G2B8_POPTR
MQSKGKRGGFFVQEHLILKVLPSCKSWQSRFDHSSRQDLSGTLNCPAPCRAYMIMWLSSFSNFSILAIKFG